jgi:hypothetical protein
MVQKQFGVFLNTILSPDNMNLNLSYLKLKIFLSIVFITIFSYNFYIAHNNKYNADADAADFISIGVSLAKSNHYGHLNVPKGIINDFKNNKVSLAKYSISDFSTWRPPVWPMLIAFVFLIFGYNLTYLLIFKFLLHLLGVFLFNKTLKFFQFKELTIIIGTFLYGVSPAWQLYTRFFLSEPITLFFITLWVYFLVKAIIFKSSFIPQAICAGLLILCHPYFIFFPFSIWLMLLLKKQMSFRVLTISFSIGIIIVSIWVIRNSITLNTTTSIITTSTGAVMAKGWNKYVPEYHTNMNGDLANESLVLEEYKYDKKLVTSELKKNNLYKDATLNFIKNNPELILPIIGKKLLSAFNPIPEIFKPGVLETGRWLFHILSLLSIIYILVKSKNNLLKSMVLGLIMATVLITIIAFSGFRFRMPQIGIELVFIIFALNDLMKIKENFSRII